jgi:hypothetical protein
MNSSTKTRLAILGTMSELHRQPIRYDLHCLQQIITDVSPDLLCAEITPEDWERGDLSRAAVDVREALTPVISCTDIVLIPVAPSPEQYVDFAPRASWRHRLVLAFDRLLRWGQIQAGDAQVVNGLWFGVFCHIVCWLTETFWMPEDRGAWERQNQELVENLVQAVQRDSGRRILVAIQCQRRHRLLRHLRAHNDLFEVVRYQDL